METLNVQQIEARVEELQGRIAEIKAEIAELRAQLPKQPGKLTAAFCKGVEHSGAKGAERHTAGPGGHGLALVVQPAGAPVFFARRTAGPHCRFGSARSRRLRKQPFRGGDAPASSKVWRREVQTAARAASPGRGRPGLIEGLAP